MVCRTVICREQMRSEQGCLERVLQTITRLLFVAQPSFADKSAPTLDITYKSGTQKSAGGVWRFLGGSQNTSFTTRAGAMTRLHFSSRW